MEFASFFNSLGTAVTVIEMRNEILPPNMDAELSALLRTEYAKRGINFLMSTTVNAMLTDNEQITIQYTHAEGRGSVSAEKVLMSVGRRPVLQGFGLENTGIPLVDGRRIEVNDCQRTHVENIYACGDITGQSMLAHSAVRMAEVAVHHILGYNDKMSLQAVPGVVYTNPEYASVGCTMKEAEGREMDCREVKLPLSYSGRFTAENEGGTGLCKIVISNEDDRVVGVHLLGNPASELIIAATMAVETGMKAWDWERIIFPHPTVAELIRDAAWAIK
jgi:dihydrolipoamide dehydrogenase